MLLRFRGPDGTFRIPIEPSDTFRKLGKKVRNSRIPGLKMSTDRLQLSEVLPDNVDYTTLTLSNRPTGGEVKLLKDIASFEVSRIGMQ
jgi:nuclear protein localization family protein 4